MITHSVLPTRTNVNGSTLNIDVYQVQGSHADAPHVYIQTSVHGAETQGYAVILLLLEAFAKNSPLGTITLVPYANPFGMNLKMGEVTFGRFDPNTGDNWNRFYAQLTGPKGPVDVADFVRQHPGKDMSALTPLFKAALQGTLTQMLSENRPYASKLNLQLQQMACMADIVLDLHCDTVSLPHVYTPNYALASALDLNFGYYIEVPETVGGPLDESSFMPWWHLQNAFNQAHPEQASPRPAFEAFTLELGNYETIDLALARGQVANILSYLTRRGAVSETVLDRVPAISCLSEDFVTLFAPTGGMCLQTAPLGKTVAAGAPLALISHMGRVPLDQRITDWVAASSHTVTYPETCVPLTHVGTASLIEGMQLMKVMRKTKRHDA